MKEFKFVIDFLGRELETGKIEAPTKLEAITKILQQMDITVIPKEEDNG